MTRTRSNTIVDLHMSPDGAITSRDDVLEQRETLNQTLALEFERYLEQHPITDPS